MVRRWLELDRYIDEVQLQGERELVLTHGGRSTALTVDFGSVPPTGLLDGDQPFLRTADGLTIGCRIAYSGSSIVAFGFPLGLAHDYLWGFEPEQEPRDALAPLWEALVAEADVDRPVLAPHNLRVYVSGDGRLVLVRERAGVPTDTEVAVRVPPDARYDEASTARGDDGYVRLRVSLRPWEGRHFRAR